MKRFTDAVRQCLGAGNWYGALSQALTLPDICGSIDYPNSSPRARYSQWFDQRLEPVYTSVNHGKVNVFLTGLDCYALRCAYLHLGTDDITQQAAQERYDNFIFTTAGGHLMNLYNVKLVLNVTKFC